MQEHRDFERKCVEFIEVEAIDSVMRDSDNQRCLGGEFWTPSQNALNFLRKIMLKKFQYAFAFAAFCMLSACGGGGGGATTSVSQNPNTTIWTPIKAAPLSLSSYENKIASVQAMGQLSLIDNFGMMKSGSSINYLSSLAQSYLFSNSWAYGDFFNDGNYALMAHTFEYDFTAATQNNFGHIHFYKQSANGWIDSTSEILDDSVGCLHPRKAIVSDFNKDGRPDVFINCTGVDSSPWVGESSRLLISSSNGKYKNQIISWATSMYRPYTHGSSAADINGDGYPDIVVSDHTASSGRMGVGSLINNKNGEFTFKSEIINGMIADKTAYTVELIKVDGRSQYDLFLSGSGSEPTYNYEAQFFENNGGGNFTNPNKFPAVGTYGLGLDAIYNSGYFYILRTIDVGPCCTSAYSSVVVQKIKYPEMNPSRIIYSHSGNYLKNNSSWINWIAFKGENVVSMDADYDLNISK